MGAQLVLTWGRAWLYSIGLVACAGSRGTATTQAVPLAIPAAPSAAAPAPPPSPSPPTVSDDVFTLHRPTVDDKEPPLSARPPDTRRRPSIRVETVQVTGGLPVEVIQRIVQLQHSRRFRECYEAGLATNPVLGGRVAVKFTIDAAGDAVNVADAGSNLADRQVVSCVLAVFPETNFPRPEAGVVEVFFPLSFTPPEP